MASKAEGEARGETLTPFPSNCVFIDLVSHPFSSQDSAARCPLPAGWTPAPDALLGGRCRWRKGRFASARPPGGDRSQPRRPRRPGTTLARGVLLAPREGAAVPAVQDSGVGRRGRVRGARAGWLRGPAPSPQAPGPRLGEEACGRGGPPVTLWARERPTAAPAAASSGSAKLAFRIPELRAGCWPAPRAL